MTPALSPEQRKALDEQKGRPIVVVDADRQERFLLIPQSDHRVHRMLDDTVESDDWTEQHEARRRELIDKDIADTITADERVELAVLDHRGNAHYDRVAPPPVEGVSRLYHELLNKRGSQ